MNCPVRIELRRLSSKEYMADRKLQLVLGNGKVLGQ